MMTILRFITILLLTFIAIIATATPTLGYPNKPVNILAWWGYLDKSWVENYIKQKCHTKISYDEYYTNEEFLRRFRDLNNNYDVIIYADTLYNMIKSNINRQGPDLAATAKHYLPYIKANYLTNHYYPNTAYFFHAITGFMWNPDLIQISRQDDLTNIFQKANYHIVIMLDDAIQMRMLNEQFTVAALTHSINMNNIFITNDLRPFDHTKLAVAYLWSGVILHYLLRTKAHYQFLVHPKYSYFSSDLITALSNTPQSICVAKTMASKDFLDKLQNDVFYLSPYADVKKFTDPNIRSFYENIVKDINLIQWLRPLTKDKFTEINQTWNYVKLHIYNHETNNK